MGTGHLQKLTMPKWGLSMTQGTVVDWLVESGQEIVVGTEVVEVETEKILNAVESPVEGRMLRLVAKAGDELPVGALLAVVGDDDVPDAQIDEFVEQCATILETEEDQIDEPISESVEVGGRTLQYLKRGEGGRPLVLIHGFGGDLNNWMFNFDALAASREVFVIDLPGHGGSTKDAGDGSIDSLAKTVGGFLDAVGIDQAHLAGHSLGGAIATDLALNHPSRVLSLTLIASAGLGEEINHAYIDGFVRASRRNQLKPFLQQLFADPDLVTRQLVEDILKFKRIDGVPKALTAIAQQLVAEGKQTSNYRDCLADISVPILVLWGVKDQIIPVSHAEGLPASVQTEILNDHGHMLHVEAAGEVNRLMEEFLHN